MLAAATHAQPQLEFRIRILSGQGSEAVVIRAPKLGATHLVAARDATLGAFVAQLTVPTTTDCVLPVDVEATAGDREETLHLQLIRARLSSPIEANVVTGVGSPSKPTRIELIAWQNELGRAVADVRMPVEPAIVQAYFRGRLAFQRWYETNPAHENTMRGARLWFDASYQLAKLEGRPYRMDRAAIEAVGSLEEQLAGDPDDVALLRSLLKPGYASQLVEQANAMLFRYAGEVASLTAARRYSEALELNSCLLEEFSDLDSAGRASVTKAQGVTEEQLRSNDAFLRQKAEASVEG